jgi:hypothetical protein
MQVKTKKKKERKKKKSLHNASERFENLSIKVPKKEQKIRRCFGKLINMAI